MNEPDFDAITKKIWRSMPRSGLWVNDEVEIATIAINRELRRLARDISERSKVQS